MIDRLRRLLNKWGPSRAVPLPEDLGVGRDEERLHDMPAFPPTGFADAVVDVVIRPRPGPGSRVGMVKTRLRVITGGGRSPAPSRRSRPRLVVLRGGLLDARARCLRTRPRNPDGGALLDD